MAWARPELATPASESSDTSNIPHESEWGLRGSQGIEREEWRVHSIALYQGGNNKLWMGNNNLSLTV